MTTTDWRKLCSRMADELDHYRQLLADDRREVHRVALEARAALARWGSCQGIPDSSASEPAEGVDRSRIAGMLDFMPDGPPNGPAIHRVMDQVVEGGTTAKILVTDKQRDAIRDAIASALGSSAYDCDRVWSAWSVGTMGEDDFAAIAQNDERIQEIADAAIEALQQQPAPAELAMLRQQAAPVPVSERLPDTSDPSECRMPFGDCWWFDPYQDGAWYMDTYQSRYTHWLPATALPLPAGEVG